MEMSNIQAIVTEVGEDNILGFVFDNSSRKLFSSTIPFSMVTMLSDDGNMFKFREVDTEGIPFWVYKHPGEIQTIMTVEAPIDRDRINLRYVSG